MSSRSGFSDVSVCARATFVCGRINTRWYRVMRSCLCVSFCVFLMDMFELDVCVITVRSHVCMFMLESVREVVASLMFIAHITNVHCVFVNGLTPSSWFAGRPSSVGRGVSHRFS